MEVEAEVEEVAEAEVEAEVAQPTRSSFVTKASATPLKVVSKAPAVVGKSAETV